ncbi:hypothetical protein RI138_11115 [Streptomyces sp. C11-1]|uniref:Translation initiation factor IF-2 n=1 Tax=Streptomyces durocortorensis TaxID=2811104 RepID=A0ABY9VW04_9ACTN|nr:hypothetical protein [Streptomyces durocortorensis]WNF27344.1 hypothetical protein RI138_11115 [Streptomyces durocortorensis]
MDNWREGMRTGHTHEPNDATMQLDGLGRQLAELPGEPAPPDSSEGPVFVDESGRRGKTFRRLGWALATVCVAYAVTLVFAVLGGSSSAPWLPLSEPKEEAKAEEAEADPAPGDAADPSDGAPEATPGASGPAAPESGTPGSAAPSATSVVVPAGSTGSPSASAPAAPPSGTGGGGATEPAPATSAAKPPDEPPPPSPEPEPEPPAPTSGPTETPEPPVQEESAP